MFKEFEGDTDRLPAGSGVNADDLMRLASNVASLLWHRDDENDPIENKLLSLEPWISVSTACFDT